MMGRQQPRAGHRLLLRVLVVEQDAAGTEIAVLSQHEDAYADENGCPVDDPEFRATLQNAAFQGFERAREVAGALQP